MDGIIQRIIEILSGDIGGEWVAFIISLMPILELRGGTLAAYALGVPLWKAFLICGVGTMLPVPFVLLFFRQIMQWLRNIGLEKLVQKIEARAERKREKVERYKKIGLVLFVAIPLPGTGAWTGSVIAAILGMRFKHAFLAIALGTLIADILMCLISYGIIGWLF